MEKRFILVYGNNVELYSKQELQQFITTAVLNNEDITSFIVIDRTRYSVVPLLTILAVIHTKLEESPLFGTIARGAMILYAKKDYDTLDSILTI
mgnify:CR=1 FL=1